MDPQYLEEDELLIEFDIRNIKQTDSDAIEQLRKCLTDEIIGTRPMPTKMHTSFTTVSSETAALDSKLSTIYIKSADPEKISAGQTRMLHLLGRIVRLEPNSGGHAQVIRLKQRINDSLNSFEQWIASVGTTAEQQREDITPPQAQPTNNPEQDLWSSPGDLTENPEHPSSLGAASLALQALSLSQPTTSDYFPNGSSRPNPLTASYHTSRAAPIFVDSLHGVEPRVSFAPPQPPPLRPINPTSFNAANAGFRPQGYYCPPVPQPAPAPYVHDNRPPGQGLPIDKWAIRFSGTQSDLPVDEFLFRVEALAAIGNIPLDTLPLGIHQLLVGPAASCYWVFLRNSRNATWDQMKEVLSRAFPANLSDDAIRRLISDRLQRPGECFTIYMLAIQSLEVRLTIRMTQPELLETLRRNMLPHIQDRLLFVQLHSVRDLQQRVHQVESLAQRQSEVQQVRKSMARIHEITAGSLPSSETGVNPFHPPLDNVNLGYLDGGALEAPIQPAVPLNYASMYQPGWVNAMGNPTDRNQFVICWNCDEMGHTFVDCLAGRNIFCYGCGAKNYVRPQCPKCSPRMLQGNGWRGARPPAPPQICPAPPGSALHQQVHPHPHQQTLHP